MQRAEFAALILAALLVSACAGPADDIEVSAPAGSATSSPAPPPSPSPDEIQIPSLVSMTETKARGILEGFGFVVITEGTMPGRVTAVAPEVGEWVERGSTITLRVISDPEAAAVTAAEAAAEAAAAAAVEATRVESTLCGPARVRQADQNATDPDGFARSLHSHNGINFPEGDYDGSTLDEFGALCPEFAPAIDLARRFVSAKGTYGVGTDIPAGTYTTRSDRLEDCYWARVTASGDIIDNNFISFAPGTVSVTVRDGEGFEVSGCGLWVAPAWVR